MNLKLFIVILLHFKLAQQSLLVLRSKIKLSVMRGSKNTQNCSDTITVCVYELLNL